MTYQQCIPLGRQKLHKQGVENPTFDIHEILCHCAEKTKTQLLRDFAEEIPPAVEKSYQALLDRRIKGEPLAYLLGEWDFYGKSFYVTPSVLIPREDTEVLVEKALEHCQQGGRILDLCAGSGCIGISLALRAPLCQITLGELSPTARDIACRNITRHSLDARVQCVEMDALAPPLGGEQYQMIVSNPPYITAEEMLLLDYSVRGYEPHLALQGGEDGYLFYQSILQHWTSALLPEGRLFLEVGHTQGEQVAEWMKEQGYTEVRTHLDTQNIHRVVEGKRPFNLSPQ